MSSIAQEHVSTRTNKKDRNKASEEVAWKGTSATGGEGYTNAMKLK